MLVELLYNDQGFIGGFRHSWKDKPKNPPIKRNIVNLYPIDFDKFQSLLQNHACKRATDKDSKTVHFGTGFYLKIIA